jgi:hypothetical protein
VSAVVPVPVRLIVLISGYFILIPILSSNIILEEDALLLSTFTSSKFISTSVVFSQRAPSLFGHPQGFNPTVWSYLQNFQGFRYPSFPEFCLEPE